MSTESKSPTKQKPPSGLHKWIGVIGWVVAMGGLFSFVFLFALDAMSRFGNPYVGLLAYAVAPAFLIGGLLLVAVGKWLRRRAQGKVAPETRRPLVIDLSQPAQRRALWMCAIGAVGFLLLSAVGSYNTYHFTESVRFCGQMCHTVMEPEKVTHENSPHSQVVCAECHVGSGVEWYVRTKMSGMRQLYATLTKTYPRPVPAQLEGMRAAEETCGECHRPGKYIGDLDKTYARFLADKDNTPYSMRLRLKVGGSDPATGPVGGIHAHFGPGRKVEYIAAAKPNKPIPWVRVTDAKGTVAEYRVPSFKDDPQKHAIRRMDCLDCHNRTGHDMASPTAAVDAALALGRIDATIPEIKKHAVKALAASYGTEAEAMQKIADALKTKYPNEPRLQAVIPVVQAIYRENSFPEMKANWKAYPDNVGHKNTLGCIRCHDGEHVAADGKTKLRGNDCNACHVILAQGKGAELEKLDSKGLKFAHPGGDISDMRCDECHNGGPP